MHPPNLAPTALADALNHGCRCQTLDADQLRQEIGRNAGLRDVASTLAQTHPHLFSSTAVFAAQATIEAVQAAVAAIECTLSLPTWADQVLPGASAIAQVDRGPLGVFMGYDFHITPTGPQLIEINTNAGGAMLNAVLLRAQAVCCGLMNQALNGYRDMATLEEEFVAMFQSEWDLFNQSRGQASRPLRTVAIVDAAPQSQYLAPEFALFAELFQRHGIQAVVTDPASLQLRDGVLYSGALPTDTPLDLVYNRLTDFDLSEPDHTALAQAYIDDVVAVTPHPRAHALRANKQHLVTLGQAVALQALGVSDADQKTLLSAVPACERVNADNAAALWEQRKHFFFKPLDGFGARAVYRGDKLTKKVWEQILQGEYIAQALVPPPLRAIQVGDSATELKFDLRAYAYAGRVQLLAARTYSGQTTNFRTEGGGFAPVLWVPDGAAIGAQHPRTSCDDGACAQKK
ncbi:hypothetical protein HZ993_06200 [Rhodoferax sp. AJA081-3]|uniref:hypothetical protein n=1 Tax=Rhodoferax sp. AJA081-3 TaxID=2752316 RepID=UPI001ADF2E5E|nr:hypothetical protein [Rhodoferax sp. AJA081-3]QTN29411.1 hypothetical protein HZ993_06200 [Rhodoferax sp. AJA081-3]